MRLINLLFLVAFGFGIGAIDKTPDEIEIKINGSVYYQDYHYEFGSATSAFGSTDGYLSITNGLGLPIREYILFDDGMYESFDYLAFVSNDKFIVVCKEYEYPDDYSLTVFRSTVIILYDLEGEELNRKYLQENYQEFHNHNDHLILINKIGAISYINQNLTVVNDIIFPSEFLGSYSDQYVGSLTVNGRETDELFIDYPGNYDIEITDGDYKYGYTISVAPEVSFIGEMFNENYIGLIAIETKGLLYLDGIYYESGDYISICGNHVLLIQGENGYEKSIEFLILPTISYSLDEELHPFMENMEIFSPINIYSDGISMMLDGISYNSSLITSTGEHELTIYGSNNYFLVLRFRLYPEITGIENNGIYDSVTFYLFGEGYLNEKLISGEVLVDEPGTYLLDVMYGNEVYETYEFSIIAGEEPNETSLWDNYGNYILAGIIGIGAYLILRKK